VVHAFQSCLCQVRFLLSAFPSALTKRIAQMVWRTQELKNSVLVEVNSEILSETSSALVGYDHPSAGRTSANPSQAEQTVAERRSECAG
jgi:hypothetical protein